MHAAARIGLYNEPDGPVPSLPLKVKRGMFTHLFCLRVGRLSSKTAPPFSVLVAP